MPRKLDSDTRVHFRTYEVSLTARMTAISRSMRLVPCATKATARSERRVPSHPTRHHAAHLMPFPGAYLSQNREQQAFPTMTMTMAS